MKNNQPDNKPVIARRNDEAIPAHTAPGHDEAIPVLSASLRLCVKYKTAGRYRRTALSILFIIMMSARLMATAADDMQQIAKTYASLDAWSVNMTYSVFSSFTCLNPQATEQGIYIKSKQCEYMKVATVENITTSSFGIMADNESKNLVVFPPSGKSLNPINPDLALQMCEKITPIETKDGCRGYYFLFKKGGNDELAGINLIFDPKTWLVKKITMFYKSNVLNDKSLSEQPRMEITYFNYNTKPKISADFFNLSHFIKGKGDAATPQNEYAGYSIVDYRKD